MSSRTETFTVETSLPHERLDVFLHTRYPAVSRSALQRLIDEGHIKVNGRMIKTTHHPRAGEVVEVHFPPARPAGALPENIPLEILFEDDDLLVLNKPPGLATHPGTGHEVHTLVNALLHHCRGRLSGIGGVERPGIVHRLDIDTSGCLVVAKNDEAHLALSAQFAGRTTTKIYLAILCGEAPNETGDIQAPIGRHPSHRKRMAVIDEGREARTTYRVLERLPGATLVEVTLHTGRTHQIRVHFEHIGFPVVGDATYGRRPGARLEELTGYCAPRQMLHAYKLAFAHPRQGKRLRFTAPWPRDFQEALETLRAATTR